MNANTPSSASLSPAARITAAAICLLALAALGLQLYVGLERNPARPVPVEIWRQARYFTNLTNLMIVVGFAAMALSGRARQGWCAALTLWILIVGVVYHALLARELSGLRWLSDAALHTGVPAAVTAWWLAFAPKSELRLMHSAQWLGWPALYLSYALLRGEIDGRHPYFFVDPPRIGWDGVGLWSLALGLAFWIGGLGVVALGRCLSRARPHREDGGPDGLRPR